MADRIGVINKGEIILVEDKAGLMQKLGKKQMKFELQQKLAAILAGSPPTTWRLPTTARAGLHLRLRESGAASRAFSRSFRSPEHSRADINTAQSSA